MLDKFIEYLNKYIQYEREIRVIIKDDGMKVISKFVPEEIIEELNQLEIIYNNGNIIIGNLSSSFIDIYNYCIDDLPVFTFTNGNRICEICFC